MEPLDWTLQRERGGEREGKEGEGSERYTDHISQHIGAEKIPIRFGCIQWNSHNQTQTGQNVFLFQALKCIALLGVGKCPF